ncbi:unnamed protein product [Arctogadus glacialis]
MECSRLLLPPRLATNESSQRHHSSSSRHQEHGLQARRVEGVKRVNRAEGDPPSGAQSGRVDPPPPLRCRPSLPQHPGHPPSPRASRHDLTKMAAVPPESPAPSPGESRSQ